MATILPKADGPARRSRRLDWRFILYVYLHSAQVIATTLLITWGLFVLALLLVSGFSLDGLMHQLANLSTRYIAADSQRTDGFRHIVLVAQLLLASGVLFFRRHSLLPKREVRHD
jgi:Zn-dependent protease